MQKLGKARSKGARRSVGIESQELENDVISDQNTLHSPLSLS